MSEEQKPTNINVETMSSEELGLLKDEVYKELMRQNSNLSAINGELNKRLKAIKDDAGIQDSVSTDDSDSAGETV